MKKTLFFLILSLLLVSTVQSGQDDMQDRIILPEPGKVHPDQFSSPFLIESDVDRSGGVLQLSYTISNQGPSEVSSFYLQTDVPSAISPTGIIAPIGWNHKIVLTSDSTGGTWSYLVWYWDPSGSIDDVMNPGESFTFGYTYEGSMDNFYINNGVWTFNDLTAAEFNYDNPIAGQILNSSQVQTEILSLELSAPTILFRPPPTCTTDSIFSTLQYVDLTVLLPIGLEKRDSNYTMNVTTHGTTQHNSTYGNNGCAPTSLAWILQWWADHGVFPGTGANQTDRDNHTSIVELIETLGKYMNTTAAGGTSINATIDGMKKFLNDTNVPLNFTYYSDWKDVPQYDGNTSLTNLFNEFLNRREALAVYVSGAGIGHAMMITGVNTTDDGTHCGFRVTVMDPWDGKEKELCMDTADGSKDSTGYIFFNGAWRKIIGFMAISPTNTGAVVTVDDEDSLLISNVRIDRDGPTKKFTYHVKPVSGSGTLIDTFALETNVTSAVSFSDFIVPENWIVTTSNVDGKIIVYFHNNLFLGAQNVTHLNETGFSFSFKFETNRVADDGTWYVGHSGLPTINDYVEDTGIILVPSDMFIEPTDTSDTGSTISSPSPTSTISMSTTLSSGTSTSVSNTETSTPSDTNVNPLPAFIPAIILVLIPYLRRRK